MSAGNTYISVIIKLLINIINPFNLIYFQDIFLNEQ